MTLLLTCPRDTDGSLTGWFLFRGRAEYVSGFGLRTAPFSGGRGARASSSPWVLAQVRPWPGSSAASEPLISSPPKATWGTYRIRRISQARPSGRTWSRRRRRRAGGGRGTEETLQARRRYHDAQSNCVDPIKRRNQM